MSSTPKSVRPPSSTEAPSSIYSDGIIEAEREGGSELGEERLIEMLRDLVARRGVALTDLPRALMDEILETNSYRQTDDMTVIVARGH